MKVSLTKDDMAKLHSDGKLEKNGVEIEFVEESNSIESKEPFKGIKAFALSESFSDYIKEKDNPLNEGQFSWMTHDTGEQIGSDPMNRITVYMFDDEGVSYKESKYDGYGEFGGKDYYELLASMNGYDSDRQKGIDLAFGKLKTKDKKRKTLYPALVVDPRYNWKRHDFTKEAEHDPNQSWYVEDEYDDDYGY